MEKRVLELHLEKPGIHKPEKVGHGILYSVMLLTHDSRK